MCIKMIKIKYQLKNKIPKGPFDIFMSYFDLIPSELNSIIISYLNYDDAENFLKTFDDEKLGNLYWAFIFSLHFGFYLKIENPEGSSWYLRWLGIEKLKKQIVSQENLVELESIDKLYLDCDIFEIPYEIRYLTN